jgi:DMSO/TMAO reductase YedYZ molybdopterin-dependent catalytic subunit
MSWDVLALGWHMRFYEGAARVGSSPRWSQVTLAHIALAGDLARPARLTVPDLLRRPQHRADVAFECATSGIQHHRFTGPRLYDVLTGAGPGFDPARRKDRLRFLIAVTGTDGHQALLSWAEIDPDFAAAPVLLAVTIDDTPLDAAAQLVLPQDRCGARHVSGITAIRVDGGYRPAAPAPATPRRASAATP